MSKTARAVAGLIAISSIAAPAPAHAQGLENPTEEEMLATSKLIAYPTMFMDTLTTNDPHMGGVAVKLYKFRGGVGDSVTIYVGSRVLDLAIALGDSSGTRFDMFDDDSGPGANPTIDAELTFDGTYFVMVMPSQARTYGAFSIAVTEGARARAGRDEDEAPGQATVQKRWVAYGRSQSGWSYYDRNTVEQTGDHVSVRTRLAFRELQENTRGDTYDSRLMQMEIRCASRQSRLSDIVETRGGAMVHVANITGEWMPVAPGSVAEALLEKLCGA